MFSRTAFVLFETKTSLDLDALYAKLYERLGFCAALAIKADCFKVNSPIDLPKYCCEAASTP